jgi:hypothetical protein
MKVNFHEAVKMRLFDIIKAAGFSFDYNRQRADLWEQRCKAFSEVLEANQRLEAVEVIRKLQDAVKTSFGLIAQDMAGLEQEIHSLKKKIKELENNQ